MAKTSGLVSSLVLVLAFCALLLSFPTCAGKFHVILPKSKGSSLNTPICMPAPHVGNAKEALSGLVTCADFSRALEDSQASNLESANGTKDVADSANEPPLSPVMHSGKSSGAPTACPAA